jgi:hypothetical protein
VDTQDSPTTTPNPVDRLAATSIGLGVAAIVGIFTALGIQGDLLARLLRNVPEAVTWSFVLAIVGVAAGVLAVAVSSFAKRRTVGTTVISRILTVAGLGALAFGAVRAINAGVEGAGIRDQPTVAITPLQVTPASTTSATPSDASTTSPTPSNVLVRVDASGSFLASQDRLFLRVAGFPAKVTPQEAWGACSSTAPPFMTVNGGEVLAASEVGPSTSGTATSSETFNVSTRPKSATTDGSTRVYRYICAHALLSDKLEHPDYRWVTALLDLELSGVPSPTTTGSASS